MSYRGQCLYKNNEDDKFKNKQSEIVKLSASLCFHFYAYPCSLKAWYK